jgi:GxxExxY protein
VLALAERKLEFARQLPVRIQFHGHGIGEHRLDLLVAGSVVVELKAVQAVDPIHFAIVRSYLKATGARCGLILNFAATTLQVNRVGPRQMSEIPEQRQF